MSQTKYLFQLSLCVWSVALAAEAAGRLPSDYAVSVGPQAWTCTVLDEPVVVDTEIAIGNRVDTIVVLATRENLAVQLFAKGKAVIGVHQRTKPQTINYDGPAGFTIYITSGRVPPLFTHNLDKVHVSCAPVTDWDPQGELLAQARQFVPAAVAPTPVPRDLVEARSIAAGLAGSWACGRLGFASIDASGGIRLWSWDDKNQTVRSSPMSDLNLRDDDSSVADAKDANHQLLLSRVKGDVRLRPRFGAYVACTRSGDPDAAIADIRKRGLGLGELEQAWTCPVPGGRLIAAVNRKEAGFLFAASDNSSTFLSQEAQEGSTVTYHAGSGIEITLSPSGEPKLAEGGRILPGGCTKMASWNRTMETGELERLARGTDAAGNAGLDTRQQGAAEDAGRRSSASPAAPEGSDPAFRRGSSAGGAPPKPEGGTADRPVERPAEPRRGQSPLAGDRPPSARSGGAGGGLSPSARSGGAGGGSPQRSLRQCIEQTVRESLADLPDLPEEILETTRQLTRQTAERICAEEQSGAAPPPEYASMAECVSAWFDQYNGMAVKVGLPTRSTGDPEHRQSAEDSCRYQMGGSGGGRTSPSARSEDDDANAPGDCSASVTVRETGSRSRGAYGIEHMLATSVRANASCALVHFQVTYREQGANGSTFTDATIWSETVRGGYESDTGTLTTTIPVVAWGVGNVSCERCRP